MQQNGQAHGREGHREQKDEHLDHQEHLPKQASVVWCLANHRRRSNPPSRGPEELEEATYLGLLFVANVGGAVVAAIGIYRNYRWGWGLGALVAGGAFAGYVISRTIGLPGMPVEDWLQLLGVLSLLVEGLFIGLWLANFARPAKGVMMD
jgi:hypothetical protein